MNKLKQLTRQLVVLVVIAGAATAGAGVAWYATGEIADAAAEKKKQADTNLSQDTQQLNNVKSELDRSGEAEKRFVEIQQDHTSTDFTNNVDTLKEWMRDAKTRYRLANNFKLNLPQEKPADKSDLQNLDYDISLRKDVTIDLEAMSDLHVFSFVEELEKNIPGITRVTELTVERRGDIQPSTYAQMTGGMTPYLVTAKVKFDWIGINPKEKPDNGAAKAATPAGAGGMQ